MSYKHCSTIDIVKYILTIWVALMHFESFHYASEHPVFAGGYLAVDFFFLLSGFFVYRSYKSGKYKNAIDFTINRLKKFIPYALFVMIAMMLLIANVYFKSTPFTLKSFMEYWRDKLFMGINEALFFQMFMPTETTNLPMWYISVMIFIGLGLYSYLENRKSKHSGLLLLICLLVMSYLCATFHSLDLSIANSEIYTIRVGLLRGFAEMGIGLFIAEQMDQKNISLTNIYILPALIIWVLMCICMGQTSHSNSDFTYVVLCSFFILICFSNDFISNWITLPKWFEIMTKNIYFCHMLVICLWTILRQYTDDIISGNLVKACIIYMIVLTISSFILEGIIILFKKVKITLGSLFNKSEGPLK